MKIHNYDGITKEFLSESLADPSPLEEGVFMIPAFAVKTAPPQVAQNEVAVWDEGAWIVKPDFRDETAFAHVDGEQMTISGIGPVPDGYTLEPRPTARHVWNEGAWALDAEKETAWKIEGIRAESERRIEAGIITAGDPYRTDDGTTQKLGELVQGFKDGDVPSGGYTFSTQAGNAVTYTSKAEADFIRRVANAYRAQVLAASHALQVMDPTPANFADDVHWPNYADVI